VGGALRHKGCDPGAIGVAPHEQADGRSYRNSLLPGFWILVITIHGDRRRVFVTRRVRCVRFAML